MTDIPIAEQIAAACKLVLRIEASYLPGGRPWATGEELDAMRAALVTLQQHERLEAELKQARASLSEAELGRGAMQGVIEALEEETERATAVVDAARNILDSGDPYVRVSGSGIAFTPLHDALAAFDAGEKQRT